MTEHSINKLNNFIGGWYIDPSCCDNIIDYFIKSNKKHEGQSSKGINKNIKFSIDCALEHGCVADFYLQELQKCADSYIQKYPYCNNGDPWGIIQAPNIQYYPPSGGYYEWHCERQLKAEPFISRHLVYMTYLNDVVDSGETEFYHQQLKIKPEKGLTLIWPVDWTFFHRGIPSMTEEKYIITGWYNYIKAQG